MIGNWNLQILDNAQLFELIWQIWCHIQHILQKKPNSLVFIYTNLKLVKTHLNVVPLQRIRVAAVRGIAQEQESWNYLHGRLIIIVVMMVMMMMVAGALTVR